MLTRSLAARLPFIALLFPLAAGCGAGDPGHPGQASEGVEGQSAEVGLESGCAGVNVPGDYATIQAAVNALEASIGGTICLAAQTYNESPSINASASLTIRGKSRAKTTISGTLNADSTPGTLTLEDLTVANYTSLEGKAKLQAVNLRSTSSAPALTVTACDSSGCASTVTVNAADIQGSSTVAAIEAYAIDEFGTTSVSVTVTNSYIHDSWKGLYQPAQTYYESPTFDLVNNTFTDNATAIETDDPASLTYYNNIFSGNGTAVDLTYSGTEIAFSNNAYHGNTTNFAGQAVEGANDVKSALGLTKTKPPALNATSPCRGAALASVAPKTDFHGNARDNNAVDIGAVQSSP